MLGRLARGDATVNELAQPFDMTQQAISRHVKVLEQAGLISRTRDAQSRPCHLEPDRLDVAAHWISEQRRMWEERYDRLDEHLETLQAERGGRSSRRDGAR
jgi:DNA-binding transcriptional ArsR family regulator